MGTYYYSGGRKLLLERDHDHVAVDQRAAERAGLGAMLLDTNGLVQRGVGVLLTPRSALEESTLASLQEAGALQPVYKGDKATIVVLPEVRIEFDDAKQKSSVMAALSDATAPAFEIIDDGEDRLVVRPTSGHGDDALKLANYIHERAHPPSATARFMQFLPKPSLQR